MKKILKISALTLAVIMMCLSFSGCAELDLMREEQCFWTNEDNIDSITLSNEEVYLKLDDEVADNLYYPGYSFNPIHVTEKDVPVLLSREYSTQLELSDNKNYIYGFVGNESGVEGLIPNALISEYHYFVGGDGQGINVLYCKEELYDDIMKQYNDGIEYTHYGYDYHIYQYDDDGTPAEDISGNYDLTKEETKLVDKILKDIKPDTDSDVPYDSIYICTLFKLSENNIFCGDPYEIYTVNDDYYIAKYSDALDTNSVYKVPTKYDSDFDNITKVAREAQEDEYYDEYYAW